MDKIRTDNIKGTVTIDSKTKKQVNVAEAKSVSVKELTDTHMEIVFVIDDNTTITFTCDKR